MREYIGRCKHYPPVNNDVVVNDGKMEESAGLVDSCRRRD